MCAWLSNKLLVVQEGVFLIQVLLVTVFANISPPADPSRCSSVLQPWVVVVATILGIWRAPELFQCKVWLLSTESPRDFSQLFQFCTTARDRLGQSFFSDLLQKGKSMAEKW